MSKGDIGVNLDENSLTIQVFITLIELGSLGPLQSEGKMGNSIFDVKFHPSLVICGLSLTYVKFRRITRPRLAIRKKLDNRLLFGVQY